VYIWPAHFKQSDVTYIKALRFLAKDLVLKLFNTLFLMQIALKNFLELNLRNKQMCARVCLGLQECLLGKGAWLKPQRRKL